MEFMDRYEAGQRLAVQLAPLDDEHPIVVALPRGGVPVGHEVARALGAPLEILAVRKLGAPGHAEYAVGAIAEGNSYVLDERRARQTGMTRTLLEVTLARERRELRFQVDRYRGRRQPMSVDGRAVVIVDDGMATGLTTLAAVRAMRDQGAREIIVAVPVASAASIAAIIDEADEVICQTVPHKLVGVGRWYRDFAPVTDREVLTLLAAGAAMPD